MFSFLCYVILGNYNIQPFFIRPTLVLELSSFVLGYSLMLFITTADQLSEARDIVQIMFLC